MQDSDRLLSNLPLVTVSITIPENVATILTDLLKYSIGNMDVALDGQGSETRLLVSSRMKLFANGIDTADINSKLSNLKWPDLKDTTRLERERDGLAKYDDWEEDLDDTNDELSF